MNYGWPITTIGESCTITSGGTPSRKIARFWNGDIPWVSAKDLKRDRIGDAALHISEESIAESATKIAPVGSLLMLVRGMGLANGVAIAEVTAPVAFNQDIRAIHPPEAVIPRFLVLALKSGLTDGNGERVLSSAAHGTLKIDTEALRRIPFPLPPLPEQRRIVGIFDEAFAGIANARANAERNRQNARALFESRLNAVFTERGEGWTTRRLGEVCGFQGGSQPPKSEFVYSPQAGYVRFLQIRDFASDKHVTFIPKSKKNRTCNADDVLIGRYGASVGKILTRLQGAYNVALIKTIPDHTQLNQRFLYYYLHSATFQHRLRNGASRSAQNGFSKDDIFDFPIPLPRLEEQARVVDKLELNSYETQRLESLYRRKLAALDELKKSLLQRAFSGEL